MDMGSDISITTVMEAPARRPTRRLSPERGVAADTRDRLIAAAATVFNRDGYHGTDSNRLARAAGYAPATFYKHFPDKRTILLAAYEAWVTTEWQAIGAALRAASSPAERAERIVDLVLAHHRRWKGLRASLGRWSPPTRSPGASIAPSADASSSCSRPCAGPADVTTRGA